MESGTKQEPSGTLDDALAAFSAKFGIPVSAQSVLTAKFRLVEFMWQIKHTATDDDRPLLMAENIDYALYRLGERFGVLTDPDFLSEYEKVNSKYLEQLES